MGPIIRLFVAAVLIAIPLTLLAQTPARPRPKDVQPIDDIAAPPTVIQDATIEPQVSVRTKGEERIEEYRVKGKLYKMRVFPSNGGAPYWLVDPKGDGEFVRSDSPTPNNSVPMWVILEW